MPYLGSVAHHKLLHKLLPTYACSTYKYYRHQFRASAEPLLQSKPHVALKQVKDKTLAVGMGAECTERT